MLRRGGTCQLPWIEPSDPCWLLASGPPRTGSALATDARSVPAVPRTSAVCPPLSGVALGSNSNLESWLGLVVHGGTAWLALVAAGAWQRTTPRLGRPRGIPDLGHLAGWEQALPHLEWWCYGFTLRPERPLPWPRNGRTPAGCSLSPLGSQTRAAESRLQAGVAVSPGGLARRSRSPWLYGTAAPMSIWAAASCLTGWRRSRITAWPIKAAAALSALSDGR